LRVIHMSAKGSGRPAAVALPVEPGRKDDLDSHAIVVAEVAANRNPIPNLLLPLAVIRVDAPCCIAVTRHPNRVLIQALPPRVDYP
jgi:hypothetical protein